MSANRGLKKVVLNAGGGILDMNDGFAYEILKVSGADTLGSSLSIVDSSSYSENYYIKLFYSGNMDFNGKSVDFFGKTIPPEYQSVRFVLHCFHTGTPNVWDSFLVIDPTVSNSLPELDDVTAELNTGSGEGKIIIGQGGGAIAGKDVTGPVSIDKDGLTAIEDDSITPQMLTFGLDSVIVGYEKTLTNGQLTNLFTNPIEILSDSGVPAGTFIAIESVAFSYKYDAASLVLADDFELQYNDGTAIMDIPQAELIMANDVIWWIPVTTKTIAVANRGIRLAAKTSNPSGGGASTTLRTRIYYTATQV